jgi:hypothetical protein
LAVFDTCHSQTYSPEAALGAVEVVVLVRLRLHRGVLLHEVAEGFVDGRLPTLQGLVQRDVLLRDEFFEGFFTIESSESDATIA